MDQFFLDEAFFEAQKAADQNEVPVGAVLVDANQHILARSHNSMIRTFDVTAHAEVNVLRQAGMILGNYRLPNTTLYVTLEPCPMCTMAMIHARVERVVFGVKDSKTGACGSVFDLNDFYHLNHHVIASYSRHAKASALLSQFFLDKR